MTRRLLARWLRWLADWLAPEPPPAPVAEAEPEPAAPLPVEPESRPLTQLQLAQRMGNEIRAREVLHRALRRYSPDEPPAKC